MYEYHTNGLLYVDAYNYRKWDINGHLTSQPVLDKPRGRDNSLIMFITVLNKPYLRVTKNMGA